MTALSDSAPFHFIVFSTLTGEAVVFSSRAHKAVEYAGEFPSLDGARHAEVLDCGDAGREVWDSGMSLPAARDRFPTVYRGGSCGPYLSALSLVSGVDLPRSRDVAV